MEPVHDPSVLLESLLSTKTPASELLCLQALRNHISSDQHSPPGYSDNYFESKSYLQPPLVTFGSQDGLNNFVRYIFYKKYGSSEVGQDSDMKCFEHFGKEADSVEETLNIFHDWITDCELCQEVLDAFVYAIQQAQGQPVVRHQTVKHLMEWLIKASHSFNNDTVPAITSAILMGLTDIWSAVRKSCTSRLHAVIEHFSVEQLCDFFAKLVKVCQSCDEKWQAQEGALLGMHVVVRSFQWISSQTNTSDMTPHFVLLCGQEEMDALPDIITQCMQGPIFRLLAHQQLSVREIAIKAYTAYIARCDFKVALSAFHTVVTKLHDGCSLLNTDMAQGHSKVTSSTSEDGTKMCSQEVVVFLDAYEAEGLLGVCVHLAKHITASHLLSDWTLYSATFAAYLTHPASTVRQTSSTIFKFLVAKESSNPNILKRVLHGLCSDWLPDMASLTTVMGFSDTITESEQGNETRKSKGLDRSGSHKWDHVGHGKRTCVTKLKRQASSAEQSEAWQWREGSLLAYELILQFLIKNHLLYTFGSAQLTPPQAAREHTTGSTYTDHPNVTRLDQSFDNSILSKCSEIPRQRRVNSESYEAATASQQTSLAMLSTSHPSDILRPYDIPRTLPRHFSYFTSSELSHGTAGAAVSLLLCAQADEVKLKKPGDLSGLLEQILYQTVESMADVRWELRRMGQQLLPCIVEVLRWYDGSVLERLWDGTLTSSPTTTLLTYTASLSFLYSLQHITKLQMLLSPASASDSENQLWQAVVHQMSSSVEARLEQVAEAVVSLLRRPELDKLSITALHILIVSSTIFSSKRNHPADKHLSCLTDTWLGVFVAAHAGSEVVRLPPFSSVTRQPFVTPTEGFFCCCLHPEQETSSLSQQYEKSMVTELMPSLGDLLAVCPVLHASSFLPALATYITHYSALDITAKSILDSLSVAVKRCHHYLESCEVPASDAVVANCSTALHQMASTITCKTLDVQTLRSVLDLYLQLCGCVSVGSHTQAMLAAVSAKLQEVGDRTSSPAPVTVSDISSHHHVTVFNNKDHHEESTDEEAELEEASLKESGLLNMSGNSGGSGVLGSMSPRGGPKSPRGVPVSPRGTSGCPLDSPDQVDRNDEDDEGSDWDDWSDEEEEDNSIASSMLREFYRSLKHKLSVNHELDTVLQQLPMKDRDILAKLN